MFRAKWFSMLSLMIVVAVLSGFWSESIAAAAATPLQPSIGSAETERSNPKEVLLSKDGRSYLPEDGLWFNEASPLDFAQLNTLFSTGGPDDFGYVWDNAAAYQWVDMSGAANTGLDCSEENYATGAIPIGFDFDFYEYTYAQLYITCFGYISFQSENLKTWPSRTFPTNDVPNNVIAPLWTPVDTSILSVKYDTFGTSSNQTFVVEWRELVTDGGGSTFTFEMILHENGDIDFEYQFVQQNEDGGSGKAAGIESSTGLDGFALFDDMDEMNQSGTAVHISRPPAGANLLLTPASNGSFMSASEMHDYPMLIKNYGFIGSDSFTISVDSDWTMALFESDGTTPLVNPIVLANGEEHAFLSRVTAPALVMPTETDIATITATSAYDPLVKKSAAIISTFQAPFAQIVDDKAYNANTKILKLEPGTGDIYNVDGEGYFRAVLELPNHNLLVAWTDAIWNDYTRIYYTILGHDGSTVVPPTILSDTDLLPNKPDDLPFSMEAAPGGEIGILWRRTETNEAYHERDNIYFSILEADGTGFILEPTNLTQKTDFFDRYSSNNQIQYNYPRLEATQDGHFFLVWKKFELLDEQDRESYQFSIYDNAGIKSKDIADLISYEDPYVSIGELTMTEISGNGVFLAWNWDYFRRDGETFISEESLAYQVMNSDGSVAMAETRIPDAFISEADALQLGDGVIMIAFGWPDVQIYRFDGTTFAVLGPAETIWQGNREGAAYYPCLTRGPFNNAVITWQFSDEFSHTWNLFYALVASSGEVLTPPINFFGFVFAGSDMYNTIASETGQSLTSYYHDYDPFFRSPAITDATATMPYIYNILADDGNLPEDTLTITAETKPIWMSFVDHGNGTATLSGMPPSPGGPYHVVLKVVDTNLNSTFQHFSITAVEPLRNYLPLINR